MTKIAKDLYSLFENSYEENIKSTKIIKSYLNDFINSLCLIYDIKDNLKSDFCLEETSKEIFFLKNLGIINNISDLQFVKNILKNDYARFMNVISAFLNLNVEIDDILKKYMDSYRKESVEFYINDHSSPTIVDFFCGAGGLSLGFHQNKFKILLANDIEEVCTQTYSFNHLEIPRNRIITGDIKQIVDNIDSYINDEVDVIVGGPPCQGFSMANRQRIIDDPRNVLYKYYVKGVQLLKPKFFVMENVKGMLSVAEQVKEDFHNLKDVDYDVAYHIFNAKDFSVPQNRERLIYIGIRKDVMSEKGVTANNIIQQIEEDLINSELFVLEDAIMDLRPLKALNIKNATEIDTEESGRKIDKVSKNKCNKYIDLINMGRKFNLVYNHKARYNNERDIEIYGRMLPGDKSDSDRIKDIMPYKNRENIFKDKYFKLIPTQICKTITAHMKFDCNMYIHPFQARGLTPRESARIQSYPDDYMFLGPYTKTYMQIGNSVPPLMSRKIAKIIKTYL